MPKSSKTTIRTKYSQDLCQNLVKQQLELNIHKSNKATWILADLKKSYQRTNENNCEDSCKSAHDNSE